MKREEMKNVFNYVKEMLASYKVETLDNGTNYILDFENGTSFSVDDVESMFDYDYVGMNEDDCNSDDFKDYVLRDVIYLSKKQTYYIDYCTGVERDLYTCSLDEAKQIADKFACYTQCNIKIIDGLTKEEVTCRTWRGCFDGMEEEESPLQFGSFGYYGDWHEID